MPRVSSAPEDAYHFKGTFQEGWGEIVDAKAVVFQFPPAKEARNNRPVGHQDPPSLQVALTIQRLQDGDGTKSPIPPEEVLLSVQRADAQTGFLDACHPGDFPDGDLNSDPIDKGNGLGAEGNTLFAMQDGYQINDKTKWMSFTLSLVEKGFKPEILKRTYFPDLIGLRAYFTNVVKAKQGNQDFDASLFVVKEIRQFPYEKAAVAAKKAGATVPKGKPVSAPAKAGETAIRSTSASGSDNGDLSAESIAESIIQSVAAKKKGALLPDVKRLKVEFFMAINSHKPTVPNELKAAVQKQLGNEEWLQYVGLANDLFEVQTDGKVQFAN